MRNQWFMWTLVAAVIVSVLVIFNYQGKKDAVSLSQIFPDQDKDANPNIEYEFVDAPKGSAVIPSPKTAPADQAVQKKSVEQQAQAVVPLPAEKTTPPQVAQQVVPPVKKPNVFTPSTAAVVKPNEPIQSVQSVQSVHSPFTIQVASLKDRQSAEMMLKGIKAAGHPGYIVEKELGAKGTWYRIYVGQYQTKDEANKKLSELKTNYRSSFIISP